MIGSLQLRSHDALLSAETKGQHSHMRTSLLSSSPETGEFSSTGKLAVLDAEYIYGLQIGS